MKFKKIIFIGTPILLVLLAIVSSIFISNINLDSIKFKNEYEKYNNKENDSGNEYLNINISSNNSIKYSSYEEIFKIFEKGSGIIYLGFPTCPWCRSAVPVLLDVASDYNIDTIYYMNIYDDRDSYVVEDKKLVYEVDEDGNELKGTDNYLKLVDILSDYLLDYTIEYDGKTYDTDKKRIYFPTVIFVSNGSIVGVHTSTVSTQEDPYKGLTDDEYDELYSIYEDYILKLDDSTCPISGC